MKLLRSANQFDIISSADIITQLPMGNYHVGFGPHGRIYLSKEDEVVLPEKVYSNDTNFIAHVMETWENMSAGVAGAGLVGKKGLGKSFTANQIAATANVPVIRIIGPAHNPEVFKFLDKIEQDFVLLLDEFEKNFNQKRDLDAGASQEDLLTFLDNGGERKNKILFLVTANHEYSINEFLKNRPSRLRYYRVYNRLEDPIINEIIEDLVDDKSLIPDLLQHLPYEDLNIDVLIQIIQEMNIHKKAYSTFKSFFNYSKIGSINYTASIILENNILKELTQSKLDGRESIHQDDRLGVYEANTIYSEEYVDLENGESKPFYEAYYFEFQKDGKRKKINVRVSIIEKEDRYKYTV